MLTPEFQLELFHRNNERQQLVKLEYVSFGVERNALNEALYSKTRPV